MSKKAHGENLGIAPTVFRLSVVNKSKIQNLKSYAALSAGDLGVMVLGNVLPFKASAADE
jgi:hypothetical protein